jgi:pimeloyl-ACP methyl ester carboxylesterase
MKHYTRSARLQDHRTVINHLRADPPRGWNGNLIFIGCSEGGPLITALTIEYAEITRATINWCGAGDWNWRDELWAFVQNLKREASWWFKLWDMLPRWLPYASPLPYDRNEYDNAMNETIADPCTDIEFLGMTSLYHADAQQWPSLTYDKIKTPYLVVAGAKDSIIESCNKFVHKAQKAGAPVTYMYIPDMDHYVRHRPDVIEDSFKWLAQQNL